MAPAACALSRAAAPLGAQQAVRGASRSWRAAAPRVARRAAPADARPRAGLPSDKGREPAPAAAEEERTSSPQGVAGAALAALILVRRARAQLRRRDSLARIGRARARDAPPAARWARIGTG
jgi:hypothetical protein